MKSVCRNSIMLIEFLIIIVCCSRNIYSEVGHFWHVTDFHLDNNYSVNGDPNRMCWFFSESGKRAKQPDEFGDYNCDAPIKLVESAVRAMKEIFPSPDFIVWTGDDTTHVNDSFFSTDIVVGVISQITDVITEAFPNTFVLPVLGNHDLYPQNQAPVGQSELQTKVANLWKKWLDPFLAYNSFQKDGRYIAHIPNSTVSIVAFNTLQWYSANKITANDPDATDPAGQFAWADNVIQDLVGNERKIYLMGHIPPGSFERYFDKPEGFHWYQDRYNTQYIDLINKHWSGIEAQLFGHHHTDSFRVFMKNSSTTEETPISYLLIAPAVSPMRSGLSETAGANNPGIRLFTYDKTTGEILEVSQYYLDLEEANMAEKDEWQLEYNLTSLLNLNSITPQSLYEATLRLKANSTLFENYYPVNTVQWENATSCQERCRLTQICSITEIDYEDYFECNSGDAMNSNLHLDL